MNIQNLKKAREKANMTQAQVAQKLGITSVAYQNYEYGKREPNNELLLRLADMFHVTTDYLLGRNIGEPTTAEKMAEEFNMSALEQKILDEYLALPQELRGDMMDFLEKAVKQVIEESTDK